MRSAKTLYASGTATLPGGTVHFQGVAEGRDGAFVIPVRAARASRGAKGQLLIPIAEPGAKLVPNVYRLTYAPSRRAAGTPGRRRARGGPAGERALSRTKSASSESCGFTFSSSATRHASRQSSAAASAPAGSAGERRVLGAAPRPVGVDDDRRRAARGDDEVAVPGASSSSEASSSSFSAPRWARFTRCSASRVGRSRSSIAPPRAPSPRRRWRVHRRRDHGAPPPRRVERRRGRRRARRRAARARRSRGLRVEQPRGAVEPAARDARERRRLVGGRARAPGARSTPARPASESRRNGTSWQRDRIVSGSGPSSSATSTIVAYAGGSSRSLSSASAASSFIRCASNSRYTRRSPSNGRMCRSWCRSRIRSMRIISPSASITRRSGCTPAPHALARRRAAPPANASAAVRLPDARRAVEEIGVRVPAGERRRRAGASPRPAQERTRTAPRISSAICLGRARARRRRRTAPGTAPRARRTPSRSARRKSTPSRSIRSSSPPMPAPPPRPRRAAGGSVRSGSSPPTTAQVEVEHPLEPEPAPDALVGDRRVEVAVADDDRAARERRPDHLLDVLRARRRVQRRLGPRRDVAAVEQQLADRLAERCPARLARERRPRGRPRAGASASSRACVVLPQPSRPSKVTNTANCLAIASVMRAIVTGGAGFIGSNLVDALVARGDEVHVARRPRTGRRENVTPARPSTSTTSADAEPSSRGGARRRLPPRRAGRRRHVGGASRSSTPR